jgi:hypothetical protein
VDMIFLVIIVIVQSCFGNSDLTTFSVLDAYWVKV